MRFLSVDPLTKKYPELTPYQFASNTPIQAIDLDGLESIHFTWLFKQAKITTNTSREIEKTTQNYLERSVKIGVDVIGVSAGVATLVVATIGSGGTATAPVASLLLGSIQTVGSSTKLYFDIKGEEKFIPTTLSGSVLTTINYVSNEDKFSEEVVMGIEIAEGILTLDIGKINNINSLKNLEILLNSGDLLFDISEYNKLPEMKIDSKLQEFEGAERDNTLINSLQPLPFSKEDIKSLRPKR